MSRIFYRSTSFMLAAAMTLGVVKGIALLASALIADQPVFELPDVVVTALTAPVQFAADVK